MTKLEQTTKINQINNVGDMHKKSTKYKSKGIWGIPNHKKKNTSLSNPLLWLNKVLVPLVFSFYSMNYIMICSMTYSYSRDTSSHFHVYFYLRCFNKLTLFWLWVSHMIDVGFYAIQFYHICMMMLVMWYDTLRWCMVILYSHLGYFLWLYDEYY